MSYWFFFLSGFSFTDTDNSQDSRGREGTILFHSTTSIRWRTFRHLFATLHVKWLSHIFIRNACIYHTTYSMRFTALPNYYLIDWWRNFDFCLFGCWIDFRFRYSYMAWETGGHELASAIILVLQANRLTKCASHPIKLCQKCQYVVMILDLQIDKWFLFC